MEDTIQIVNSQNENIQAEKTVSSTTITVPANKHDKSKDFSSAMKVTGISMTAIFIFMIIFYLIIKGIDHFFPEKTS